MVKGKRKVTVRVISGKNKGKVTTKFISGRFRSKGGSSSSSKSSKSKFDKQVEEARARQKKAETKAKRERALVEARKKLAEKKELEKLKKTNKVQYTRKLALIKAREKLARRPIERAKKIAGRVAETGRLTPSQRGEFKRLGYDPQTLTKTAVGRNILDQVARTGRLTPEQRKAFKTTGFDPRLATQTAVGKTIKLREEKRISEKQRQLNTYSRKRANLINSINRITSKTFTGADTINRAKKQLNKLKNELKTLQNSKQGREFEKLVQDSEVQLEIKRLQTLKKTRADINKTTRQQIINTINKTENKINNGQSITPKDYKVFQEQFNKGLSLADVGRGLSLQKKKTLKEIKDFVDSNIKTIDIKNSLSREKMPSTFTKFVTSAGSGVIEFSKEVVLPVKIAYNYGLTIPARAKQERTKGISILTKDILKLNKGTIKARQFVQQHPYKSAVIVGAIATELGKSYIREFKKDPVKALTKAVLDLYGAKIVFRVFKNTAIARVLKEAEFVGKLPKKTKPFVRSILKAGRFQERLSPKAIKTLKKINFNEVLELNATEARALKKVLQETDSFVFGSLPARTLSGGKTKLPKDVDLATRNIKDFLEKFKKNLPANIRKKYIIKGEKLYNPQGVGILDIKGFDRLRPNQSIFGTGQLPINKAIEKKGFAVKIKEALTGKKIKGKKVLETQALTIPTQKLVKVEGIKLVGFGEQTQRKGLGTLQVILENNSKRAKDPAAFIEALELQLKALKGDIAKTSVLNPLKISKKYSAKQLEDALKILKSKRFANFLNSKVPGLTKEYPIFKKIPDLDTAKLNKRIRTKIKKIKDKLKKKIGLDTKKKTKVKKKVTKKKVTKKKVTKKRPSKLPKSKIPKSRIPKSKIPKSKIPKSRIPKSKIPKSRIPKSKVPKSRIPKSKIPKSRIPKSKIPKTTTSKTPISKTPTSKTPTSKTPTSKPPKSRIPKATPKTTPIVKPPKRIPLPRLNFNNKQLSNKILTFEGLFRERKNPNKPAGKKNPIVSKTIRIRDTKNRALKRVMRRVDNTLVGSLTLKVVGVGKAKKDINKPSTAKFRTKVAKTSPALQLVEKNKARFDTKGEVKEAKKQKRVKKSTKKAVKKTMKPKLKKKTKLVKKRTTNKKKVVKKRTLKIRRKKK